MKKTFYRGWSFDFSKPWRYRGRQLYSIWRGDDGRYTAWEKDKSGKDAILHKRQRVTSYYWDEKSEKVKKRTTGDMWYQRWKRDKFVPDPDGKVFRSELRKRFNKKGRL